MHRDGERCAARARVASAAARPQRPRGTQRPPERHDRGRRGLLATRRRGCPGVRIGRGSEVRIGGVVHVNSSLPAKTTVPIGWIAVGDPAELFPPGAQVELWAVQRELDFPSTVFGLSHEEATMERVAARYSERFGRHLLDRVVAREPNRPVLRTWWRAPHRARRTHARHGRLLRAGSRLHRLATRHAAARAQALVGRGARLTSHGSVTAVCGRPLVLSLHVGTRYRACKDLHPSVLQHELGNPRRSSW